MKTTYPPFLPHIATAVVSHECEKCGWDFIVMNRFTDDWAFLAKMDFCPRCGDGYKTDYLGMPLKDEEK